MDLLKNNKKYSTFGLIKKLNKKLLLIKPVKMCQKKIKNNNYWLYAQCASHINSSKMNIKSHYLQDLPNTASSIIFKARDLSLLFSIFSKYCKEVALQGSV